MHAINVKGINSIKLNTCAQTLNHLFIIKLHIQCISLCHRPQQLAFAVTKRYANAPQLWATVAHA